MLPVPFQPEQMSFCIEATRKAPELAGMADDAMARHKNRDGVSTIRCAYRPRGLWNAELDCKLTVRTGLPQKVCRGALPRPASERTFPLYREAP